MDNFFIPCRLVSVSIQGENCTIQWYWHGLIWQKYEKVTAQTNIENYKYPFLVAETVKRVNRLTLACEQTRSRKLIWYLKMSDVHRENHNFSRFLGLSRFYLSFQTFRGAKLQEGPNSKLQVNTTHTCTHTHTWLQAAPYKDLKSPTLILEDLGLYWLACGLGSMCFFPVPVAFSAGSVLVNIFRISSQPFTPSASWKSHSW